VTAERAVTTITAPRVVTGTAAGVLEPGYVRISGAVIAAAGTGPPPGVPTITLPSGTLAPGLVDLQVNGYYGVDLSTADPAGWQAVASRLPETGVTAFLPTFITAPLPVLARSLRAAAELIPGLREGASTWRGRSSPRPAAALTRGGGSPPRIRRRSRA
jgi:N-acetylglucosamine-6-phosphate deacetylase